ncbi:phenylacetate--CoA ligase family protein [Paraburkholderia sp. 31.1]|uniref:phenylacetate--CoA ligase family protein n=1 Tax=Paraburkholderia sp. 31.1 TaxID=2615205 RepID=UPI001656593A|nr:AMP-binding protein [Paraburkholderia sp. 31.1]MBC8722949.1 phenylacetate--CoA ligase family protein [Paraburkholderia sp. 31.1]
MQSQQLSDAVLNAYGKTELYAAKFKKIIGEGKSFTFEDLPFTTKDDLQRSFPYGALGVSLADVVSYHESSGTSAGNPDRSSRCPSFFTSKDWNSDLSKRFPDWIKLGKQDSVLVSLPYAFTSSAHAFHQAAQKAGAMAIAVDLGSHYSSLRRQLDLAMRLQPTVLVTSNPFLFSTLAMKMRADDTAFEKIRHIQLCGSAVSQSAMRKTAGLYGADSVAQTYGMSEFGAITFTGTCGESHVYDDCFYVEIINPKTGNALVGEPGEIVITTIRREGSPRIRYRTGDIGRLDTSICCCGCTSPRLKVSGRLSQLALLGESRLLPTDVEQIICGFEETTGMFKLELVDEKARKGALSLDVKKGMNNDDLRSRLQQKFAIFFDELAIELKEVGTTFEALFRRSEDISLKSLKDFARPNGGEEAWLVTY